MKRTRRTFTKQFKTEIVKNILTNQATRALVSTEKNISLPLLDRWINDYLANNRVTTLPMKTERTERRKDYATVQELKAKIADLYMQIERFKRAQPNFELPKDWAVSA